ncbi:DUF1090 domain-containing protein [Enterobacillus tribolii]|uniref:Uncharacterized protein DUF1090 n=1 Tax=Enterobacillus tribolii TaxID=1487935 RepID=A0A370QRI6_9GAMM|nr:DUF1090 domain-containing protein [Enterobacillus tribolii]MBW7981658.1 DUF1090 domain-containing protein [Enterobacillus tribolii]RDK91037.1 uncharacterized protein DUF1090 [Enterobacillus tribolii]
MKFTKRTLLSIAMIAGLGTMSAAHAYEDCNAKRAALENQIRIAEQYGNYNKVMGLKKALANVNAYCTNDSVAKDAEKKVQKLENKIADKKADISEIKADLNKAKAKGDAKKVAKYQSKLTEKQAELKELQAELKAARAQLAAMK